jgi:hypothetical protein
MKVLWFFVAHWYICRPIEYSTEQRLLSALLDHPSTHRHISADETRWRAETLIPQGHGTRPVLAFGEDWIELGECVHCGESISRTIAFRLRGRSHSFLHEVGF